MRKFRKIKNGQKIIRQHQKTQRKNIFISKAERNNSEEMMVEFDMAQEKEKLNLFFEVDKINAGEVRETEANNRPNSGRDKTHKENILLSQDNNRRSTNANTNNDDLSDFNFLNSLNSSSLNKEEEDESHITNFCAIAGLSNNYSQNHNLDEDKTSMQTKERSRNDINGNSNANLGNEAKKEKFG